MSTTQKKAMSNKGLEQEATLKRSSEELQAKSKEVVVLQNQVKELEEKLKQKVSFFHEPYFLAMNGICIFKFYNFLIFSAESTITIRILPHA